VIADQRRAVYILHALSVDDTEKLVLSTIAGDRTAWHALQLAIEPTIMRMARRHRDLRRKGLADLPDDLADIRTASLERLVHADFSNLRNFLERRERAEAGAAAESFDAWLYGVVDFVIREHLRRRFGRAPKVSAHDAPRVQPSKRELSSYAGRIDDGPEPGLLHEIGVTTRLTIAEILAYIDSAFSPREAEALRLHYVDGQSFEGIATQLGFDSAKEAERVIRRLNGRLRYRFLSTGETER
jgi:DNA-directed RNA polymerase specialized sigma24 family protein